MSLHRSATEAPSRPPAASSESSAAIADRPGADIWKSLVRKARTGEIKVTSSSQESTIIFVGPRQSGKTTLIYKFINPDKEDAPKPTLGVEYVHRRTPSTKDGATKEVSHIWEIGGGNSLAGLLEVCLTMQSVPNATVVITLDLSKPSSVLSDLLFWLDAINSRIKKIDVEARAQKKILLDRLKERAARRFGEKHPDNVGGGKVGAGHVLHSGINIIVAATNLDHFASTEPELRKIMFRTLRFFAHFNGASLISTATDNKQTLVNFRTILGMIANRVGSIRSAENDHMKPILIPAGLDSIEKIGPPGLQDPSLLAKLKPTELWKTAFESYFPRDPKENITAGFPTGSDANAVEILDPKGQFAEPDVDAARSAKEEELARYREEQVALAASAASVVTVSRTQSSAPSSSSSSSAKR